MAAACTSIGSDRWLGSPTVFSILQADFRRIMTAMSEPGTIVTLPCLPGAALPLGPAAAALALTLVRLRDAGVARPVAVA